jgi:hypothetical protein
MNFEAEIRRKKMFKVGPNKFKSLRFILSSGDGEDYPGCKLNIVFWKWNITIDLPPIIKPEQKKVYPASWDGATILRLGRDWYWQYTELQYGVYLFENHFNILYGRRTDDSSTEQRWSCFLPWSEFRHVRHSLYGLSGELFFSQDDTSRSEPPHAKYDIMRLAQEQVPKAVFSFLDFDGEEIEATTHIEEREWHRGEKWCKWLSLFYKPLIRRSLDIQFSKETGPRKGSWKGGTLGHGIEIEPGELHESAFRRYCQQHNMTLRDEY